ncbi:MAG: histidine kinase, partial [Candidatus Brockarchaeota archaeon]|nr:histidine kinase [Candidatus Brockarchaeota archaeon]
IFDLVGVGLTGLLPGLFAKPEDALSSKGLLKATLVSLISGIVMVPIVAMGFELVGVAPFVPALVMLSLSDLPPIIVGTPIILRAIVPVFIKRKLIKWRL